MSSSPQEATTTMMTVAEEFCQAVQAEKDPVRVSSHDMCLFFAALLCGPRPTLGAQTPRAQAKPLPPEGLRKTMRINHSQRNPNYVFFPERVLDERPFVSEL